MLRGTLEHLCPSTSILVVCLTIFLCFVFATFKGGKNGTQTLCWGFPGGSVVENRPASAGDAGSIRGSARRLKKEMATYSHVLAWKTMDRGAWWATVHGVTRESDAT